MVSSTDTRAASPVPEEVAHDFTARWRELAERWGGRHVTLGTIGPAGTSSDLAAGFLAERYGVRVRLFETFDEVFTAVLDGRVELALVPSAYHGLTRFHWHPGLRLVAFFPKITPDYGIASRAEPPAAGPVTVAAMWEVRRIYAEVVPPELREREVMWLEARSTQHAAQLLAKGECDLAVTNAAGVQRHGLRWVARRPGAEIVWTLFGRTGSGAGSGKGES